MRATIQVNEMGSWRNVTSYQRQGALRAEAIVRALAQLAEALGERPTWRVFDSEKCLVQLDDKAIRKQASNA